LRVVKTKKTELLFIGLILRMLKPGGRSATIVPDGVLFGSSKAHVQLRQYLIENNQLEAVISLPSGVFKPYAGVSTAIIIFTKGGKTENVFFYDVQSDGYSLDDKRVKIGDGNGDLSDLQIRYQEWNAGRGVFSDRSSKAFQVSVSEIQGRNYDLSINSYKETKYSQVDHEAPLLILERLKKFGDFSQYIDSDKLDKKNIGCLSFVIDKSKLFYNQFYKRGFLTSSGPSGSILYYLSIYLSMINANPKSGITLVPHFKSTFYLLSMFFMGIRGDHSIFEMVISLPWNLINKKLDTLFTKSISNEFNKIDISKLHVNAYIEQFIKSIGDVNLPNSSLAEFLHEWKKYNQTNAWNLLYELISNANQDTENIFQELLDVCNNRIQFILQICNSNPIRLTESHESIA
jgi:hypothetical protein